MSYNNTNNNTIFKYSPRCCNQKCAEGLYGNSIEYNSGLIGVLLYQSIKYAVNSKSHTVSIP